MAGRQPLLQVQEMHETPHTTESNGKKKRKLQLSARSVAITLQPKHCTEATAALR